MLAANTKVTADVKGSLGATGEWKTAGDVKASRPIVRSPDHHGKADTIYKSQRKKFAPLDITRVCGTWDWDHKAQWLALNHDSITVTELVFDDDGNPYGKGLVIHGEVTDVAFSKRDRGDETGLATITVTIEPTDITEA
jgi:hypothetical protein